MSRSGSGHNALPEEHEFVRGLKANANHLVDDTQGLHEARGALQQAVSHRKLGRLDLSGARVKRHAVASGAAPRIESKKNRQRYVAHMS